MNHTQQENLSEIEYRCSQLVDGCYIQHLSDLFPIDFMHKYTTFLSYPAMLTMLHVDADTVMDVADLVRIDTVASDRCIAQHTEFGTWRELVVVACDHDLAENIK